MIDLSTLRREIDALVSLRRELAAVVAELDPSLELSFCGLRDELGLDLGAVRRLERMGRIHPRRTSRRRRAWKRYSVRQVLLRLLLDAPRAPMRRRSNRSG